MNNADCKFDYTASLDDGSTILTSTDESGNPWITKTQPSFTVPDTEYQERFAVAFTP